MRWERIKGTLCHFRRSQSANHFFMLLLVLSFSFQMRNEVVMTKIRPFFRIWCFIFFFSWFHDFDLLAAWKSKFKWKFFGVKNICFGFLVQQNVYCMCAIYQHHITSHHKHAHIQHWLLSKSSSIEQLIHTIHRVSRSHSHRAVMVQLLHEYTVTITGIIATMMTTTTTAMTTMVMMMMMATIAQKETNL